MTEQLDWQPALSRLDLVAEPVAAALRRWARADEVQVAEIDPSLADTTALCARYDVALDESANCVVVAARRGERMTLAACVVLATTRADVNNLVRRRLDARKASFAATDIAVAESSMEYGGITPVGLPPTWPLLVDAVVASTPSVVIGSGIRKSKLRLPGPAVAELPNAEVLEGLGMAAQ